MQETLTLGGVVQFKSDAGTKELTGFTIEAYTGQPVTTGWGQKIVVDIAGISAKDQMPIFRDHDRSQIVGHSTSFSKDGSFCVTGVFSKTTQAAQAVKDLAKENFPWQASIGVSPSKITQLRSGEKVNVNGLDVVGPMEIWERSIVSETSFVPLGADSNTKVAVFNDQLGNKSMDTLNTDYQLAEFSQQWASLNKQEQAEFCGDYEIFAAYQRGVASGAIQQPIPGGVFNLKVPTQEV